MARAADAGSWCDVYVRGIADDAALARLIAAAVGGAVEESGWLVITPDGIGIDIDRNDFKPKYEREPPDPVEFVTRPYTVGLEVDEERGTELVTLMLRAVWDSGASAVAACDFEHRLPRSGGYRAGRLILSD